MDIMSLDKLAQEVGGKVPPIQDIGGIMWIQRDSS